MLNNNYWESCFMRYYGKYPDSIKSNQDMVRFYCFSRNYFSQKNSEFSHPPFSRFEDCCDWFLAEISKYCKIDELSLDACWLLLNVLGYERTLTSLAKYSVSTVQAIAHAIKEDYNAAFVAFGFLPESYGIEPSILAILKMKYDKLDDFITFRDFQGEPYEALRVAISKMLTEKLIDQLRDTFSDVPYQDFGYDDTDLCAALFIDYFFREIGGCDSDDLKGERLLTFIENSLKVLGIEVTEINRDSVFEILIIVNDLSVD